MPQSDISTYLSQLFWLTISFGLLYFLLSKFCLPNLSKIFVERDAKVSEALAKAEHAKNEANRLRTEYEANLAKTAKDKSIMISEAAKEVAIMIDSKMLEHNLELEKMYEDSEKRMRVFEEKAESSIEQIAKDASKVILTSLLGMKTDEGLIEQALKEAKDVQNV